MPYVYSCMAAVQLACLYGLQPTAFFLAYLPDAGTTDTTLCTKSAEMAAVWQTHPSTYNAFATYSLSKYARQPEAAGSSEALNLAVAACKTLENLCQGVTTGGYDESSTTRGSVFDSVSLSGTNSACQQQQPQSFNTLLHVAEALTELSRATGGGNS